MRWRDSDLNRLPVDSTRPTHSLVDARLICPSMMTYRLVMLAESCVDDSAVEQDLGGVGDLVKTPQRLVKVLVVIGVKSLNPCLDFLDSLSIILDMTGLLVSLV